MSILELKDPREMGATHWASIWKPSFPLDCRNKQQLGLTILRPRWSAVHMRNIAKKINSQFERLARFPPRSVAVQSTNTLGTQKWSTIPREPAKMPLDQLGAIFGPYPYDFWVAIRARYANGEWGPDGHSLVSRFPACELSSYWENVET
jgi:hypothetical protein